MVSTNDPARREPRQAGDVGDLESALLQPTVIAAGAADVAAAVQAPPAGPVRMPVGQLALLFFAQATLFMALVAPGAFSLAIKISALDAGNRDTMLALALGVGGSIVIFTNPVFGVLSDRTRLRIGRRRPWMLFSLIVGLLGSVVVAFAPNAAVVVIGWAVAIVGYTAGGQTVLTFLGDRLPESQRGKVMGISGAITQIGPIAGILIAGAFASDLALIFLIPAGFAFLGTLVFALTMKDPQFTCDLPPYRTQDLVRGFWFNPRRHKPFAWVLVSKFFIFVCVSLSGVYGVYLLITRLGVDPTGVAGIIGTISILGVVTAIVGAVGSGWLSDKLRSRKPFLVVSAVLLAAGAVLAATAYSVEQYIFSGVLGAFAIGVYSAVDQALAFDALPSEENENGRYLSLFGLANSVPQAIGAFLAAGVLALAGGDYGWVYWVAGTAALLGGAAVLAIKVPRPAKTPRPTKTPRTKGAPQVSAA